MDLLKRIKRVLKSSKPLPSEEVAETAPVHNAAAQAPRGAMQSARHPGDDDVVKHFMHLASTPAGCQDTLAVSWGRAGDVRLSPGPGLVAPVCPCARISGISGDHLRNAWRVYWFVRWRAHALPLGAAMRPPARRYRPHLPMAPCPAALLRTRW